MAAELEVQSGHPLGIVSAATVSPVRVRAVQQQQPLSLLELEGANTRASFPYGQPDLLRRHLLELQITTGM